MAVHRSHVILAAIAVAQWQILAIAAQATMTEEAVSPLISESQFPQEADVTFWQLLMTPGDEQGEFKYSLGDVQLGGVVEGASVLSRAGASAYDKIADVDVERPGNDLDPKTMYQLGQINNTREVFALLDRYSTQQLKTRADSEVSELLDLISPETGRGVAKLTEDAKKTLTPSLAVVFSMDIVDQDVHVVETYFMANAEVTSVSVEAFEADSGDDDRPVVKEFIESPGTTYFCKPVGVAQRARVCTARTVLDGNNAQRPIALKLTVGDVTGDIYAHAGTILIQRTWDDESALQIVGYNWAPNSTVVAFLQTKEIGQWTEDEDKLRGFSTMLVVVDYSRNQTLQGVRLSVSDRDTDNNVGKTLLRYPPNVGARRGATWGNLDRWTVGAGPIKASKFGGGRATAFEAASRVHKIKRALQKQIESGKRPELQLTMRVAGDDIDVPLTLLTFGRRT